MATSDDIANAASAVDDVPVAPLPEPPVATIPEPVALPPAPVEPVADQSLSNLESAIQTAAPAEPIEPEEPEAPTVEEAPEPPASLDFARDEVLKALNSSDQPLQPVAALNAQPMMDSLHGSDQAIADQPPAGPTDLADAVPLEDSVSMAFDPAAQGISEDAQTPVANPIADAPTVIDPNAAPPVPPPIPFSFNAPEPPVA